MTNKRGSGEECHKHQSKKQKGESANEFNRSIEKLRQLLAEEMKHEDLIAAIPKLRDLIRGRNRPNDHQSSFMSASSSPTQSDRRNKIKDLASKMVQQISDVLTNVQHSEMPKKIMEMLSKVLDNVGKANFILLGCLFVGDIISKALQTAENISDCSAFLKTMEKLLDIIIELLEPMHGNLLSDSHLQDAVEIILDSVIICCRYQKDNFFTKFFNTDSMEKELKHMEHCVLNLMQRMQLAVLGAVAKRVEKLM